jgi:MoaA/NifB/PqqE/SkfB family radical SAM enzyme
MFENNKSMCAIPFVSTMINTDTTVRYCCMVKGRANIVSKESGDAYTCRDNFIEDAWNSESIRDIRRKMINAESIPGCAVCYQQEDDSKMSNRQHSLREWSQRLGTEELKQIIESAGEADGFVESAPVYLDLRLGNLCNLKCRMCNPWNSSQIVKEHTDLVNRRSDYADVWQKTFGKFPEKVMEDQPWFDHNILWDQVISLIPTLKKVYMTGGEPTLIKNNFKFMEECIRQGRQDITLFFNTNCTNINPKFFDLISQFDAVNINASVDGVGVVTEYIRAPSNWLHVSKNIEKFAQMPNVHLGITPTFQVYNTFDVVNILTWVDDLREKYSKDVFIDFLINHHPVHLSALILPDDLRKEAVELIEDYNEANPVQNEMTKNSLQGIVGFLKNPRLENWEIMVSRFRIYTNALDEERKESITVLDPRLAKLYD